MPVFDAHVSAGRFTPDQKRALADAFNRSLVDALTPVPIENFSFGRGVLQMAESGPRW